MSMHRSRSHSRQPLREPALKGRWHSLAVGFYVTQCHRQLWQEVTREQTRIAHALADEHPRTAVQVDARAGGVKGVHALRQEAPDNTGEYVARAGGGERGIPRPVRAQAAIRRGDRSEEHTSELQSQ